MHLIAALSSGVIGAENGVARFYRRGTSTRATVYPDFEASSADSSGEDVALDSTGGVVVYVNELVQVQVYSSLGQLIRDFVAGEGAYAVEVISSAFTGTDYTSGQQGTSRPATLGAILDRWLTSAGTIDWEVLFNGSPALLQDALGSIYGMFFNVKSPEFGAIGDGATDDTASWQAAHDAAAAAGGGIVVAPFGTYNISSTLNWSIGVHLLMMPGRAMLRQTSAATPTIAVASALSHATIAAGMDTYFIGGVLDSTVTNSATQFTVGHGTTNGIVIDGFRFCASDFCTGAGVVIGSSLGRTQIRNSQFVARASTILVYDTTADSLTERVWVDNCDFSTWVGNAYTNPMVKSSVNELRVTRSRFYFQSTSGDSVGVYMAGSTYPLTVSDCYFKDAAGGAVSYAVQLFVGGRFFVDNSNYFGPGVALYLQAAATDITSEGISELVLTSERTGTVTVATTHTIPNWTKTFLLRSTNTSVLTTLFFPEVAFYGQVLHVVVWNNSGSGWAGPFGVSWVAGHAAVKRSTNPTLADLHTAGATFVACNLAGSPWWVQVGDWTDGV